MIGAMLMVLAYGAVNAALVPRGDRFAIAMMRNQIQAIRKASAETPGPRLILAGGSNVMYGYDPAPIQDGVGLPVINAGLTSTLGGLPAYGDFLATIIKPGDVVVFSEARWWRPGFEDALFAGPQWAGVLSRMTGIGFSDSRPSPIWILFPTRSLLRQLAALETVVDDPEIRRTGNAQNCGIVPLKRQPLDPPAIDPSPALMNQTQALANKVRARGGTVYFAPSWVLVRPRDRARWQAFSVRLSARLGVIAPVLKSGPDENLQFRKDWFCDGPTHLSVAGRARRSRDLVKALADMAGQEGA